MSIAVEFELRRLHLQSGYCPFEVWFESLSKADQQIVDSRLLRVRCGNLGEINTIGGGIWELKFRKGAGFRIYYARVGRQVLLLIGGGTKGTQIKDIKRAKELFSEYEKGELKNENL